MQQIETGIVPAGTELFERMWFLPAPIVLAPVPRAVLGKKMELHAGMAENLDFHVGRLVDTSSRSFERTVREEDALDRRFLEALLAARSAPKA